MSDDEDDFMSDKFLASVSPQPSKPLTYAEKRKKAITTGQDRGRVLSRAEREKQARDEALNRDLIREQREAGEEGESKAVKMMRKMGFKPGEALGVKRGSPGAEQAKGAVEEAADVLGASSAPDAGLHRGLGASASSNASSAAPTPPIQKDDRLIAPISIHLRSGRTGLGVPSASAPRKLHLTASQLAALTPDEVEQREAYLAQSRGRFDGRRVEGQLNRARRTCEELDRRTGKTEGVMWLDPGIEQQGERKRLRRMMEDRDGEEVMGAGVSGRRLGGLTGELEGKVVDVEGEEVEEVFREERDAWFALDSGTRLAATLEYLRRDHRYCLWCGAQYDTPEQLAEECPGENEDDH